MKEKQGVSDPFTEAFDFTWLGLSLLGTLDSNLSYAGIFWGGRLLGFSGAIFLPNEHRT